MSFGYAVGDFIAVGHLAWTLYRQCYLVARGAPQEFQHLLEQITMLSQAIKFLQEEVNNPQSTLVRAGDDRVQLVNQVMGRVKETLKELEKCANRYEKLGDTSQPKVKQMWRRVKWSTDAADLDALRNKVTIPVDSHSSVTVQPCLGMDGSLAGIVCSPFSDPTAVAEHHVRYNSKY